MWVLPHRNYGGTAKYRTDRGLEDVPDDNRKNASNIERRVFVKTRRANPDLNGLCAGTVLLRKNRANDGLHSESCYKLSNLLYKPTDNSQYSRCIQIGYIPNYGGVTWGNAGTYRKAPQWSIQWTANVGRPQSGLVYSLNYGKTWTSCPAGAAAATTAVDPSCNLPGEIWIRTDNYYIPANWRVATSATTPIFKCACDNTNVSSIGTALQGSWLPRWGGRAGFLVSTEFQHEKEPPDQGAVTPWGYLSNNAFEQMFCYSAYPASTRTSVDNKWLQGLWWTNSSTYTFNQMFHSSTALSPGLFNVPDLPKPSKEWFIKFGDEAQEIFDSFYEPQGFSYRLMAGGRCAIPFVEENAWLATRYTSRNAEQVGPITEYFGVAVSPTFTTKEHVWTGQEGEYNEYWAVTSKPQQNDYYQQFYMSCLCQREQIGFTLDNTEDESSSILYITSIGINDSFEGIKMRPNNALPANIFYSMFRDCCMSYLPQVASADNTFPYISAATCTQLYGAQEQAIKGAIQTKGYYLTDTGASSGAYSQEHYWWIMQNNANGNGTVTTTNPFRGTPQTESRTGTLWASGVPTKRSAYDYTPKYSNAYPEYIIDWDYWYDNYNKFEIVSAWNID